MPRVASFLLLFFALAPLARAQAVGTQLPPIELQGLTQTDARRFSDFYGRTVLLEFFAYWCGPCARSVRHLNELHEKYSPRGLSIVGVTSEGPTKTEPWVKQHELHYAYAYDMQSKLEGLFNVKGIPFAVLIDPFGTIQWSGHPQELTDERLERALAGSLQRPVWQWPPAARELGAQLSRGEFAGALHAAEALTDGAAEGVELVRERIAANLAHFERAVERTDYRFAFQFAERLRKDLATLPEAEAFGRRVAELEADPEVKRLRAGQDRLAELESAALSAEKSEELTTLRPKLEALAGEYPDTKIERRARALISEIDRVLATPRGKRG